MAHCYQQSLYRCITCQDVIRQNAYYRNLKQAFEDLLLYYCYAKNNSRKIRSQTWPRKGAHMNELQAHYCMTQNSEPGSCAACHTDKYADTARIPQVIRFKLLTSGFLENFGS